MRSLDSYVHENSPQWVRLEELVVRANKRRTRLSSDDLEELLIGYQRTSAHLSYVRTTYAEPAVTARLTRTVSGARAVIYGERSGKKGGVRAFFFATFPASVWIARRQVVISAAALLIPALVVGIWIANSPAAIDAFAPDALREAYINDDFEQYYSSAPAAEFSTQVLTNNIQVSFVVFVAGIAWSVPSILLLAFNGANIGLAAGLFHDAGQASKFWGLILPHGLLEMSAIIVAGAAGLRLGWSLVAPGDRTRSQSLIDEAQKSVSIVLGLVLVFIIAGLIEGFVTPSSLPTQARVAVGVAAFTAFWAYIISFGSRAVAAGHTGAMAHNSDATTAIGP